MKLLLYLWDLNFKVDIYSKASLFLPIYNCLRVGRPEVLIYLYQVAMNGPKSVIAFSESISSLDGNISNNNNNATHLPASRSSFKDQRRKCFVSGKSMQVKGSIFSVHIKSLLQQL